MIETGKIYNENCLETLRRMPAGFLDCVVSSPPYFGLRDYGTPGQIGREETPAEFIEKIVAVFAEVRRALKDTGTVWINMGDSYATAPAGNFGPDMPRPGNGGAYRENKPAVNWKISGYKQKEILGMPWRVAFALQADGWYLRQDIIWSKPNPMPESVTDRCTKAHEYIFLLTKRPRYFYDADAIRENHAAPWKNGTKEYNSKAGQAKADDMKLGRAGISRSTNVKFRAYNPAGRNKHSVWTVSTLPYSEAHFATFPPKLIEPCILAGCPAGGIVYDPFTGAGTTWLVSHKLGREFIGSEINAEYVEIANRRLAPHLTQANLFQ